MMKNKKLKEFRIKIFNNKHFLYLWLISFFYY